MDSERRRTDELENQVRQRHPEPVGKFAIGQGIFDIHRGAPMGVADIDISRVREPAADGERLTQITDYYVRFEPSQNLNIRLDVAVQRFEIIGWLLARQSRRHDAAWQRLQIRDFESGFG